MIGPREQIEHPPPRGMTNRAKYIRLATGGRFHADRIRKETLTCQACVVPVVSRNETVEVNKLDARSRHHAAIARVYCAGIGIAKSEFDAAAAAIRMWPAPTTGRPSASRLSFERLAAFMRL